MRDAHKRQEVAELYARVARDEEAAAKQSGYKNGMVDQLRRRIGL